MAGEHLRKAREILARKKQKSSDNLGPAPQPNGHVTNSAGNTEAQQTFTVKIDESAPDATITSGPSGPTNDSTPPSPSAARTT